MGPVLGPAPERRWDGIENPRETPQPKTRSFRQKYDDLERGRALLLGRLNRMGHYALSHPAYDRALRLLNDGFRGAAMNKRASILQAAEWVINLIESSTGMI